MPDSAHSVPPTAKLNVVVRGDLPPDAKCPQAVHAAFAFAFEHPKLCAQWMEGSNTIVVRECGDVAALEELLGLAEVRGIAASAFREPDLGNALTAAVFAPGEATHRTLRALPLMRGPVARPGRPPTE